MTIDLSCDLYSCSDDWEPAGASDPFDRLMASINVNGCMCHLEAIRVVEDEARYQSATGPDYESAFGQACEINGDNHFQTARIGGFEYVIIATSFAS